MSKCDEPSCKNKATSYGLQQCYLVCADHVEWGLEIERNLMWEMDEAMRKFHEELEDV